MSNSTVKIVVATHKKYIMPTDSMYVPIHVGAEGKKIQMEINWISDISRIIPVITSRKKMLLFVN